MHFVSFTECDRIAGKDLRNHGQRPGTIGEMPSRADPGRIGHWRNSTRSCLWTACISRSVRTTKQKLCALCDSRIWCGQAQRYPWPLAERISGQIPIDADLWWDQDAWCRTHTVPLYGWGERPGRRSKRVLSEWTVGASCIWSAILSNMCQTKTISGHCQLKKFTGQPAGRRWNPNLSLLSRHGVSIQGQSMYGYEIGST